jgi:hypothetical protein
LGNDEVYRIMLYISIVTRDVYQQRREKGSGAEKETRWESKKNGGGPHPARPNAEATCQ